MKIFFPFFIICFLAIVPAQSQKPGEYDGYVRYDGSPSNGTISLISTGFGKTRAKSSADAAAHAFYTLLFRGIPGSQYELPVISNENEKKNDPAVKKLLSEGYSSFVTENIFKSEDSKTKRKDGAKGKMTVHKITINCDALRKHLEDNGVIRKFGI